jgi:hypothetical protein
VQARRVVERSIIDSSPGQFTSTFFALSVAVFSRKRNLSHGSFTMLPDLDPADFWLFPKLSHVEKKIDIFLFRILKSVLNNS